MKMNEPWKPHPTQLDLDAGDWMVDSGHEKYK